MSGARVKSQQSLQWQGGGKEEHAAVRLGPGGVGANHKGSEESSQFARGQSLLPSVMMGRSRQIEETGLAARQPKLD